jgi:hypothetical protein
MGNGTQFDSVPGQAPGWSLRGDSPSTPPFVPSPSGSAGGIDEQTKRILTALTQAATQRRAAGTPRPSAVPGAQNPFGAPSYMTSGPNPHAWGAQRLMYGIQAMIGNAVSRHKEEQITKATADWEYAQSALNEYYAAQQSGDQQALQSAQTKLDVVFGDPKKLKLMAKALNQDWLNPEKTTPHGEALKRVAAQTQQKDQQKQQAKSGIQRLFGSLIDKVKGQQQPQYTDDEKKRMEQEIINKAPATTGSFDIKQVNELSTLERTLTEARQKYQYIPAADGSIWAVNKNNRDDAHQLRDTDTGEAVKGKAGSKEGQVYMANGMPAGIFHSGKPVMPGDADWSESDQKMFDVAVNGAKEKQFLRVDPALAAMIGDPPDPGKFKGGRGDPEYGKALKDWGQSVFDKEVEKAAASGAARGKAMNMYRPVQVMDADGGVYYTTAQKAIAEGMSGAGEGIKLKSRQAQIGDIETASGKEREAIMSVDKPFSPEQIAKLRFAMSTDDPGMAATQMKALAAEDLTEKQQDFVIWTNQLNERAMALRGVAGIGASAQDVRGAIHAMLPGIGSGNKQMMTKQLDAFDQQVKVLKGGIAHPGKAGGRGAEGGPVMMLAPDGKTKKSVPADQVDHFKKLGATVAQ